MTCEVTAIKDGGVEVRLVESGLDSFIKRSDLSRDRDEQRPERFAPGEKLDAKVMNVDAASRRLALSVKALEIEDEKQAMADFGSSDSGASLAIREVVCDRCRWRTGDTRALRAAAHGRSAGGDSCR